MLKSIGLRTSIPAAKGAVTEDERSSGVRRVSRDPGPGSPSAQAAPQGTAVFAFHDAKAVVSAIHANVDYLRGVAMQSTNGEAFIAALEEIDNCGRRIQNLMAEAIESVRQGEPGAIHRTSGRIRPLVRSVVTRFQRRAEQQHVSIDVVEDRDGNAHIDHSRVERVLENLLDNALRVAPPTTRIEVRFAVRATSMLLTVADEGPGVPIDAQKKVFDRYYTTTGGANAGLGLSFCREVAESHGGLLHLYNRNHGGACFVLSLPLDPA